jgi:hypothetical protein
LTYYYTALHAQQQHKNNQSPQPVRTAPSVGCNKGMDAVNTLRMLAEDPSIDKDAWRDTFFARSGSNSTMDSASTTTQQQQEQFEAGRCQQEFDDQFYVPPVTNNTITKNNYQPLAATVYCIEAMPSTAAKHTLDGRQAYRNSQAIAVARSIPRY